MKTRDYIDIFLLSRSAKHLSPVTIKWYSEILCRFNFAFPNKPPKSPESIELFLSHCPGKDERVHGYFRGLRCFYKFIEMRYHYQNPIKYIEAPHRQKKYPAFFTPREIYNLINYPHRPIVKAYLMFLADTGCRIGELMNFKPTDIIKTEWSYVVRVNGKTGERLVPICYETYNAIIKYIPIPWKYNYLVKCIRVAISNAGLKGGAHKLRHTFATQWDGDLFTLKSITGHSSYDQLEIYKHLKLKNLCIQHNMYTPLLYAKGGYQESLC